MAHRDISYLLSETVFFALGFVPGIIFSENFMVSCFPLICRTVWASVTMFTKQNCFSIGHNHSSCSAVLIVVSHQLIAFVFKSKWLISHLSTTGYDSQWNTSMKNKKMFWKTYMASPTLKQSCKLFGQNTLSGTYKKF